MTDPELIEAVRAMRQAVEVVTAAVREQSRIYVELEDLHARWAEMDHRLAQVVFRIDDGDQEE